jgi:hypothetical protein
MATAIKNLLTANRVSRNSTAERKTFDCCVDPIDYLDDLEVLRMVKHLSLVDSMSFHSSLANLLRLPNWRENHE